MQQAGEEPRVLTLLLLRRSAEAGLLESASVPAEPHPSWSDRGFGFIGRSQARHIFLRFHNKWFETLNFKCRAKKLFIAQPETQATVRKGWVLELAVAGYFEEALGI